MSWCSHDFVIKDYLKDGWLLKSCWKCGKEELKEVSGSDYTTESD